MTLESKANSGSSSEAKKEVQSSHLNMVVSMAYLHFCKVFFGMVVQAPVCENKERTSDLTKRRLHQWLNWSSACFRREIMHPQQLELSRHFPLPVACDIPGLESLQLCSAAFEESSHLEGFNRRPNTSSTCCDASKAVCSGCRSWHHRVLSSMYTESCTLGDCCCTYLHQTAIRPASRPQLLGHPYKMPHVHLMLSRLQKPCHSKVLTCMR